MRFIYGQGWVHEKTDGEGGDAGGTGGEQVVDKGAEGGAEGVGADPGAADPGDEEGVAAGDGDGDAGPKGADTGDAKGAGSDKKGSEKDEPKSMLEAITRGLEKPAGDQKKPATKGDEPKDTETHYANGKPKKDAQGRDVDDQGKVKEPAKSKTSAELDLKPAELKALAPQTQARFRELIGSLKTSEQTIAKLTESNKGLTEARDGLFGVMEEVGMTQEQFGNYVEFHALLNSGDPGKVREALKVLEEQRASIYEFLGEEPEGGGVDLLAKHDDLRKRVEEETLSRADALELARARNATKRTEEQRTTQQTAEQREAAFNKARDTALTDIQKWTDGLRGDDIDFKVKEAKLLERVEEVIKNYTPDKWLPTLKMLYNGIMVEKAPAVTGGNKRPLRPSGATGGAQQPGSMLDAINQGLGYGKQG